MKIKKSLKNFLDIKIKKNNGIYESDVHRKPALTNIQIKTHSCLPTGTITSIFNGFIARSPKVLFPKIFEVGNQISS